MSAVPSAMLRTKPYDMLRCKCQVDEVLAMIRNPDRVRRFEDDQIRAEHRTFAENLVIFEALWEQARRLGVLPTADPLDGIEVDVQLAKALHVLDRFEALVRDVEPPTP